jgi:hypothetical protein
MAPPSRAFTKRLTTAPPARHYHVAPVDPLTAGFEALNPELAITGHIPQDPDDQW